MAKVSKMHQRVLDAKTKKEDSGSKLSKAAVSRRLGKSSAHAKYVKYSSQQSTEYDPAQLDTQGEYEPDQDGRIKSELRERADKAVARRGVNLSTKAAPNPDKTDASTVRTTSEPSNTAYFESQVEIPDSSASPNSSRLAKAIAKDTRDVQQPLSQQAPASPLQAKLQDASQSSSSSRSSAPGIRGDEGSTSQAESAKDLVDGLSEASGSLKELSSTVGVFQEQLKAMTEQQGGGSSLLQAGAVGAISSGVMSGGKAAVGESEEYKRDKALLEQKFDAISEQESKKSPFSNFDPKADILDNVKDDLTKKAATQESLASRADSVAANMYKSLADPSGSHDEGQRSSLFKQAQGFEDKALGFRETGAIHQDTLNNIKTQETLASKRNKAQAELDKKEAKRNKEKEKQENNLLQNTSKLSLSFRKATSAVAKTTATMSAATIAFGASQGSNSMSVTGATGLSAQEQQDITEKQLAKGKSGEKYLDAIAALQQRKTIQEGVMSGQITDTAQIEQFGKITQQNALLSNLGVNLKGTATEQTAQLEQSLQGKSVAEQQNIMNTLGIDPSTFTAAASSSEKMAIMTERVANEMLQLIDESKGIRKAVDGVNASIQGIFGTVSEVGNMASEAFKSDASLMQQSDKSFAQQSLTEKAKTAGNVTAGLAGTAVEGIGAVGGGLAGAKLGAGVGSFLGPMGTLAGGAIGGLVGGAAGYFAGDKVTDAARVATQSMFNPATDEERTAMYMKQAESIQSMFNPETQAAQAMNVREAAQQSQIDYAKLADAMTKINITAAADVKVDVQGKISDPSGNAVNMNVNRVYASDRLQSVSSKVF